MELTIEELLKELEARRQQIMQDTLRQIETAAKALMLEQREVLAKLLESIEPGYTITRRRGPPKGVKRTTKAKRGRKPKAAAAATATGKRRGRKPKAVAGEATAAAQAPKKRGRKPKAATTSQNA